MSWTGKDVQLYGHTINRTKGSSTNCRMQGSNYTEICIIILLTIHFSADNVNPDAPLLKRRWANMRELTVIDGNMDCQIWRIRK